MSLVIDHPAGRAGPDAAEQGTREDLAASFRVAHHLGWNRTPRNHITARVGGEPDAFLMNPFGYGWDEVTASSLVKAGLDGVIRGGDGGQKLAPAGLNFHSAILAARPELGCVIHTHYGPGVAVSALAGGLVILDQGGTLLAGQVGYHAFEGFADARDEAERIVADLGDKYALIMRNHGILTVGRTVGEAFYYMQLLADACELQIATLGGDVVVLSDEICAHSRSQIMARYAGKPIGGTDWQLYRRLADRLDPGYRD